MPDTEVTLIIMDNVTKSFRYFGAILWASQEKSVFEQRSVCLCDR